VNMKMNLRKIEKGGKGEILCYFIIVKKHVYLQGGDCWICNPLIIIPNYVLLSGSVNKHLLLYVELTLMKRCLMMMKKEMFLKNLVTMKTKVNV
jgi:hypothetical protein